MHADTMAGHSTSILSGVTWPLGSSWLKRNGSQSAHGEGPQPHTLGASWAWGRGATGTSLNHWGRLIAPLQQHIQHHSGYYRH